ncbi:MAG: hypothetical protein FWB98_04865 [Defluviitaleaceae bacterium]|nr:hypothetical protein [Defluviitaleaceae bacterium]
MEKLSTMERMLRINKFVLISVMFTATTILDMAITLIYQGVGAEATYWHLLSRLLMATFAVLSLYVFKFFKRTSLPAIGAHFASLMGFAALHVWISGFFVELHQNAMWYMLRSVAIVYAGAAVLAVIWVLVIKRRKNG